MPTITMPKNFTITVYNLTGSPLYITVPFGRHTFRNFNIEKNSKTEVDREMFISGRETLQALRKDGKIWYEDHLQLPCDEQDIVCSGGATGIGGGATGAQGATGVAGSKWYTGSGVPSGVGDEGDFYLDESNGNVYQKIGGVWVLQGSIKGTTGVQGDTGSGGGGGGGITGIQGVTGPSGGDQGMTGIQGVTGIGFQGVTGFGITGPSGGDQGTTGIQGVTGAGNLGGSSDIFYGLSNRYQVDSTVGAEVWVHSSSILYNNISWTRSGTTLTLSRNSHGHAIGDMVILRNTNVDYIATEIIAITLNSFDAVVPNSGAALGISAYYSLGFSFYHSGGTGGNLIAPTGGEVQLISMRLRTGQRSGTTYDLTVPNSVINGAGANTSLSDVYLPSFSIRADSETLPAVAATLAVNQSGFGYSTFTFGNLGSGTLSRFIILHF